MNLQAQVDPMKKHILIIEDEEDIRECLKEFLETEGYQVTTALNGADAFNVGANLSKPDLILLDLMMPIMSGDEFIAQQKKQNFMLDVPVVLVSADNQTSKMAKSLGVADHLKKPMDLEDLVAIIKKNMH